MGISTFLVLHLHGSQVVGADSPRSKIPGILLLTRYMTPTMDTDQHVNLWMWSGVDETPLDSSFVYPYDSADFTTGWNSGSGSRDQFDLAAGIEHPTDYPTRLIDLPLPYGISAPLIIK